MNLNPFSLFTRRKRSFLQNQGSSSNFIVQSLEKLADVFRGQEVGSLTSHAKMSKEQAKGMFRRWQYSAATAIADAFAASSIVIETETNEGWVEKEDPRTKEIRRILRRPNRLMSYRMLHYMMGLDLSFFGEHYWRIVFNRLEQPAELWPLIGDVKPVIGSTDLDSLITGWEFTYTTKLGPRTVTLPVDEVVAIRLPMLQSLLTGASPLQASAGTIKLDDELLKSRWKAFKQGIYPLAILFMSERNPKRRKELLDEFNETYADSSNSGKTVGLNKETMDLQLVGRTPKEMDYLLSAKTVREEILAGFRTPGIIVGQTEGVQNRAVAEVSEYVFTKYAIAPKLAMVDDQITIGLIEPNWGEGVQIRHENVVPEDREFLLKETSVLVGAGLIKINEGRARHGYPKVKDGDRMAGPSSFPSSPEEAPPSEDGEGEQSLPFDSYDTQVTKRPKTKGFSERSRRIVALRRLDAEAKFVRSYRKTWGRIFTQIGRELVDELDKTEGRLSLAEGPNALDPRRMSERMADETRSDIIRGLILGGGFEQDLLSTKVRGWGAKSRQLQRYAQIYGKAYYDSIANTTRERMLSLISEMSEGKATWDEMRRAIFDTIGEMSQSRAANIAVTETTRLMNGGGQAFREEYGVTSKQWVCSFVNSRDTHVEMDGVVVRNNEYFTVGTDRMMFPGGGTQAEENCNCNCSVVSATEPTRLDPGGNAGSPIGEDGEDIRKPATDGFNNKTDYLGPEVKDIGKFLKSDIERELQKIEKAIAKESKETCFGFSANGQQVVVKRGTSNSVSLTWDQLERMDGGTMVHNHPPDLKKLGISQSFSPEDVNVALRWGFSETRVTSPTRRFQMTFRSSITQEIREKMIKDIEDQTLARQVGKKFRQEMLKGRMTLAYGRVNIHHETWVQFAKKYSRYVSYSMETL